MNGRLRQAVTVFCFDFRRCWNSVAWGAKDENRQTQESLSVPVLSRLLSVRRKAEASQGHPLPSPGSIRPVAWLARPWSPERNNLMISHQVLKESYE